MPLPETANYAVAFLGQGNALSLQCLIAPLKGELFGFYLQKGNIMEKIVFDSGVREYKLGNLGVLRFHPGDPNLYARFMEAAEKMKTIEEELVQQAKALESEDAGGAVVNLLREADRKMKQTLNWVFGHDTDFDQLLGGVNLLAVGANGERVATNLFDALQPILLAGAQGCVKAQTKAAVTQSKVRRAVK